MRLVLIRHELCPWEQNDDHRWLLCRRVLPSKFRRCYPVPKVVILWPWLGNFKFERCLTWPNFAQGQAGVHLWECIWLAKRCIEYGWTRMDLDLFPRCVMIPKTSQQKLRIGRSVGISPEVLNFKVFIRRVPRALGATGMLPSPAKVCNKRRLFERQKMLKLRSDWKLWFQQQPTLGSQFIIIIATTMCKNRRFSWARVYMSIFQPSSLQQFRGERPWPLPSACHDFGNVEFEVNFVQVYRNNSRNCWTGNQWFILSLFCSCAGCRCCIQQGHKVMASPCKLTTITLSFPRGSWDWVTI